MSMKAALQQGRDRLVFHVYKGVDITDAGEIKWKLVDKKGHVVAECAKGFPSVYQCRRSIDKLVSHLIHADTQIDPSIKDTP